MVLGDRVVEPIKGKLGQYFGRPISCDGKVQILLADFPQSTIHIFQYDDAADQTTEIATLPITVAENCYNLMLKQYPLMLTQQVNDGKFRIIWPETVEFEIEEPETFVDRKGDQLYFSKWYEEPDYQEEVVVRKYPAGEITEVIPGSWTRMPNGQIWILQ